MANSQHEKPISGGKTKPITTEMQGDSPRDMEERLSLVAAPAQREMVHLNVKLLDEMASVWNDTYKILQPPTASDLLKESIRVRALLAWYSYSNKKVELHVDGKEVDLYQTLGLRRAIQPTKPTSRRKEPKPKIAAL